MCSAPVVRPCALMHDRVEVACVVTLELSAHVKTHLFVLLLSVISGKFIVAMKILMTVRKIVC